jgi:peptide/nickel transport system substrate-binding protein
MTVNSTSGLTVLNRRHFLQGALSGVVGAAAYLQGWPRVMAAPAQKHVSTGQMTWAVHVTIAPVWFDPAETLPVITPYMMMYALHDALIKPMPGNLMSPSLATEWHQSPDGLTYDFKLRQGVKFHNGDPFSADDVLYSFERYRGAGAATLKSKVRAVEIVNAHQVRFRLHEPWPDFMTFYGTPASGAGWIVPKQYTEKVGDKEFQNQPIGLGPYRFVSYQPGVELVLEANQDYWRKTPAIKRLVMKSVPEPTTRLAMLKRQEADIAYGIFGALAEEVQHDPNLKLEAVVPPGTQWLLLANQYDAGSPWGDQRVRLAANHAINWQAVNEAETLGHSLLTGSIIPRKFEYALPLEPYGYNPDKAKQLLKQAGYANGFEAGDCTTDTVYAPVVEAAANDLAAVGIRLKVRPMERAAVQTSWREKSVKHLTRMGSGAFGNAATRIEGFIYSQGMNSFIKDPEIDEWFVQQEKELDREKRQGLLRKIQQKVYDQAYFIPIWELSFLCDSGPRVEVSGLGLIPLFAYSGPYEDVQLKS